MSDRERARFGVANLVSLAGLVGWSWYVAVAGPDTGLPGTGLGPLIGGLGRQALWFVPVGLLLPLALPRMRSLLTQFGLVLIPSVVLGSVLVALIVAAPDTAPWTVLTGFRYPGALVLLAPTAGMFAGVLLGVILTRGLGAALLAVPALVAMGAILLAIVAVALLVLTDRVAAAEPLGFEPEVATPVRLAREGDLVGAVMDPLTLVGHLRLAAVAAGPGPDFRARFEPVGDHIAITVSLPLALPLLGERFVNMAAEVQPTWAEGELRAGVRSLAVGDVAIPPWWVRMGSRALSRWFRRAVGAPVSTPELERRVHEQLSGLAADAEAIRASPDRLAAGLQSAFTRRRAESDPVAANRAALLALGSAVGHPDLLALVGMPDAAPEAERIGGRLGITFHGRRDWARHFFLSAGLTQIGPAGLFRGAGLLKERLDAVDGGSGFSFGDLLMDTAGARFGREATRSPEGARRLSERVTAGVSARDLAPAVADLPEGLSRDELEAGFGGLHGPGFLRMEAEIDRRVESLPLYGDGLQDPEMAQ